MKFKIEEEFKHLLPELTTEEYTELERDIVKNGVLSPLVIWNGIIIDGHNRYAICNAHHIQNIPYKELRFETKEEVIEWMLRNQLGRRNLSDAKRIEISIQYEDIIVKRMKARQIQNGKNQCGNLKNIESGSNGHIPMKPTTKREELAKIAGVSPTTMQRGLIVFKEGTEEQKERARRGGAGNSITAIANEIRGEKMKNEKKKCNVCKRELPINCFEKQRAVCKECRAKQMDVYAGGKFTDVKGNKIQSTGEFSHYTEKDIIGDLYNTEREITTTLNDVIESFTANYKKYFHFLDGILSDEKELIMQSDNNKSVINAIDEAINDLIKIKERYTNNEN